VLTYAFQRRFGGPEQRPTRAIQKGYIGNVHPCARLMDAHRKCPAGTTGGIWTTTAPAAACDGPGVQMLDWHGT